MTTLRPLVVAVTGASGAVYAVRLIEVLLATGRDVCLTISESGRVVFREELGIELPPDSFHLGTCLEPPSRYPRLLATPRGKGRLETVRDAAISGDAPSLPITGQVRYYSPRDFLAPIASGSFLTGGMVICPCSGGTLGKIVHGAGDNLVHRAADVHFKERRKLIVVPRETPLGAIQLENMRKACESGAIVLPASPGWYHGVEEPADLVDFIVGRILDQLEIPNSLQERWGKNR